MSYVACVVDEISPGTIPGFSSSATQAMSYDVDVKPTGYRGCQILES